ncbi:hypothetical protein BDR26DRAFT_946696, partial [Obelidium mucronatum]
SALPVGSCYRRSLRRVSGMRLLSTVEKEEAEEEDDDDEESWLLDWRTRRRSSGGSSPRVSIHDSDSSLSEVASLEGVSSKSMHWIDEELERVDSEFEEVRVADKAQMVGGTSTAKGIQKRFMVSAPMKRGASLNPLFRETGLHLPDLPIEAPVDFQNSSTTLQAFGRAKSIGFKFGGKSSRGESCDESSYSTPPPPPSSSVSVSSLQFSLSSRSKTISTSLKRTNSTLSSSPSSTIISVHQSIVMERMKSFSAKLSSLPFAKKDAALGSCIKSDKSIKSSSNSLGCNRNSTVSASATSTTLCLSRSTMDKDRNSIPSVSQILHDFESKKMSSPSSFSLHQLIHFILVASTPSPHSLLLSNPMKSATTASGVSQFELKMSQIYEIIQYDAFSLAIKNVMEKASLNVRIQQQLPLPSLKRTGRAVSRKTRRLNSTTTSFHISPSRSNANNGLILSATPPTSAVQSLQQQIIPSHQGQIVHTIKSNRNLTDVSAVGTLSIQNGRQDSPPNAMRQQTNTQSLQHQHHQRSTAGSVAAEKENAVLMSRFRDAFAKFDVNIVDGQETLNSEEDYNVVVNGERGGSR